MYQIVTEIRVNGKREMDSIFPKIYVRKRAAERNAKGSSFTSVASDGRTIETKCYVRGLLRPVTKEEAKDAYCKCKRIWIDGKYGHVQLTPSGHYGSHAPAWELFYRSVEQSGGYYYEGNYYIEED